MISSSHGHRRERQRLRRAPQPGQVLGELEDPAAVQPQPLPHRVAALHDRVERADPGLVAVDQGVVDPDDQVAVALVVLLLHVSSSAQAVGRQRVVVGPAPLEQRRQAVGERVARAGGVRREAGRGLHAGVPVRRPDTVGVARTRGPGQHRLVEARSRARRRAARASRAGHAARRRRRPPARRTSRRAPAAAAARGPPGSARRGPSRTTSARAPGRGPGTRG